VAEQPAPPAGSLRHQRHEGRLQWLPEFQHPRRLVARRLRRHQRFAIGGDSNPNNVEEQDRVDSANLYQTLTEQVIPMFFDRDEQGIPRQWIQRIRRAMVTLVPQFTTDRMVKEYTRKYYLTK
jgi:glucan phosphorylase